MTALFQRLHPDAAPPEISYPAPDRLISGAPVFTTWNVEERDGLYCGLWRSTPGAWRVIYTEWEYCRILSGLSVITPDGGPPQTLRAGDSFILRPGFSGIWEVIETTTKDYVIRL
jgi:uncharacterized protein